MRLKNVYTGKVGAKGVWVKINFFLFRRKRVIPRPDNGYGRLLFTETLFQTVPISGNNGTGWAHFIVRLNALLMVLNEKFAALS